MFFHKKKALYKNINSSEQPKVENVLLYFKETFLLNLQGNRFYSSLIIQGFFSELIFFVKKIDIPWKIKFKNHTKNLSHRVTDFQIAISQKLFLNFNSKSEFLAEGADRYHWENYVKMFFFLILDDSPGNLNQVL